MRMRRSESLRALAVGLCLTFAAPALAQDTSVNEELARELRALTWTEANTMTWRHWSDERGVEIFHDRNNGRMRRVHMDYIKGNPNAENMQVAGPGFYIASDIKSSSSFGQELMDVRLSENARVIDLTNPETKRRIQELFERHNVEFRLNTSSDLRNRQLLDFLTRHGINGARYTASTYGEGYSWTTVWEHEALESLRRGSSNLHVEMWSVFDRAMERGYGNSDPLSRFNGESSLKKLAEYTNEAEIRAFAEARGLRQGEGTAFERYAESLRSTNIEVSTAAEGRVIIEGGKVKVQAPADATAEMMSRLTLEARQVAELHTRNAEAATRAFGEMSRDAGSEFLRENVRMRAARMAEGLFHADAEAQSRARAVREVAERRASEARFEVAEMENLRSTLKSRNNVDLPPTNAERALRAFPEAFEMRTFHTEASTYYEVSESARQRFNQQRWVETIKRNASSRRALLDGVENLREVFVVEGQGGLNSMYERYNVGPDATTEMLERFINKVESRGAIVERVAAGDPRLPEGSQGRTFMGEDGKVRVLLPAERSVKAFALIDELTHVRQLQSMAEASSPAEVRALMERAAAGDRAAREVLTQWEIKAKRNVLMNLGPNDPARAVVEESVRLLEETRDPYVTARRGNGSIDWKRVAGSQVAGLGHFTLALFLKELAIAVETGDQQVITEFFDGLLTTDFYLNYGLFVAGAQGANVLYTRTMERYLTQHIRPRFINSVLKANVVLAAGMALPQIVMGHFDGKAFAIELAGLGLSSLAVKAGMAGISWAVNLERLGVGPRLAAQLGRNARLVKVGGWVYTAVELAVILYFGEKISRAINEELARREAEAALREAIERFRSAARRELTAEEAAAEAQALTEAFHEYRNYLYDPLRAEEAKLMARLEEVTKDVRDHSDALERYEDLAARDPERFGNLRRAADVLQSRYEAEDREAVERIFASYERSRARLLADIYRENREDEVLNSTSSLDRWAFLGGEVGAEGDPNSGRTGIFDRFGRNRARDEFEDRMFAFTSNRLEVYEDEADIFNLAASVTDGDAAAAFRDAAARARLLSDQERALVLGEGPLAGRDQGEAVDLSQDSLGLIRALAKGREGE